MALTGLEIYKYLPKTNCKKCGFPTCLAFAMKLAQKGVELAACPDLSEEAKAALDAAAQPPIRLVTIGAGDQKVAVGNETVMHRHEKTFFNPPGLMVRLKTSESPEALAETIKQVAGYAVERVGRSLYFNGFAVEEADSNPSRFNEVVGLVKSLTDLPLVLMARDPSTMEAGLEKAGEDSPLIYAATKENAPAMAQLALKYRCPLAVYEPGGLQALTDLVEQVTKAGVADIVLDPGARGFADSLALLTQIRRLALKKNFRLLGYPVITFPGEGADSFVEQVILAGQHIAKYAGIVVLDGFVPEAAYSLLTLRQNIYSDPQKPIQVTPGIYQVREPKPESPLLVTTNFSLTYFSVFGEVEGSGIPAWLLICDTDGHSVLTSWAAGKFDADKIAKTVKEYSVADRISHRRIMIPGHVAAMSGELEEVLGGWKVLVGPKEAVDLPSILKRLTGA